MRVRLIELQREAPIWLVPLSTDAHAAFIPAKKVVAKGPSWFKAFILFVTTSKARTHFP